MIVKSRRDTHAEATRHALISAGRQLFGRLGYAEVSVETIARRARVTTGALYHHFRDKKHLFRAAFDQVNAELMKQVAVDSAQGSDPWEQLIAGCDAWLDACRDRSIRQIVLIDAPSVLGWEEWRKLDAPYGF